MLFSAIGYDSTHLFGSNHLHQNKGIHWFFMAISVPFHGLCAKLLWSQAVVQFRHGWTTTTQHHQSILLIKGEKNMLVCVSNQNGSFCGLPQSEWFFLGCIPTSCGRVLCL